MVDVRRADLHTHTCYSDGELTPEALVAKAYDYGLRAIAITDHDTTDGIAAAMEAGKRYGVEVLPGIEISVCIDAVSVHLLGYCINVVHSPLQDHVGALKKARLLRARRSQEQLASLGLPITLDIGEAQSIGRRHIAQALLAAGHVQTMKEAFARLIGEGKPAYVPLPSFSARRALAMVHAAGGIGVLAHAGERTSADTINALVRAGLDGLETVHPAHDERLTQYYRQLARDMGLIETGGSDYHSASQDAQMSRYSIPYAWISAARKRAQRYQQAT